MDAEVLPGQQRKEKGDRVGPKAPTVSRKVNRGQGEETASELLGQVGVCAR